LVELDSAAVKLEDSVHDLQAKTFGRATSAERGRSNQMLAHVGWDTGAVVVHDDLHAVADRV